MSNARWWDEVAQDIRFAGRSLRRQPAFTAAAILTLGFGIGATAAILSVVNGVIVRPLPYPNADRAVLVWSTGTSASRAAGRTLPFSAANFADLRDQNQTFERLVAFRTWSYTLVENGQAELLSGARVSPGLFEALGIAPKEGRPFAAGDELEGAEPVAIVSEGLWRRRFGADQAILGRQLMLNGQPFRVVGVMPRGFQFPRGAELPAAFQFGARTEIWTPLVLTANERTLRGLQNLAVLGLPKRGTGSGAAEADLQTIMARLAEQFPQSNVNLTARAVPLLESAIARVRPALLVLLGAVGFLLLIACVNVSNLLLTRTAARYREIALRLALGAGRRRLLQQFMTENLILAIAGGALGIGIAITGKNVLLAMAPADLPRVDDIAVDWRVLAGVVGLVIAVGLAFGGVVASETASGDQIEGLREGSKGSGGRSRRRLRHGLVVLEVAVSVILLVGAGILGRTFLNLRRIPPGFVASGVLTAHVTLPRTSSDFSQIVKMIPVWARFYGQLADRLNEQPGVRVAGVITSLPLTGALETAGFTIEGRPPLEPGQQQGALFAGASEGYFKALSIPLVKGRFFDRTDRDSTAEAALVSASMAKKYWPNENPLGARIRLFFNHPFEVVGIVGDVHHEEMGTEPAPMIYLPVSVYPAPTMTVVIQTAGAPLSAVATLRETLHSLDPSVPLTDVLPMTDIMASSLAQQRFSALLIGAFAAGALGLAILGLYGIISFGVARRSREIGVRLALGAAPSSVLGIVLREGLLLSLLGVAIGIAGSLAMSRALAGLVFGVSAADPVTLGLVSVTLVVVAMVASLIPARRAMRVDPVTALREE